MRASLALDMRARGAILGGAVGDALGAPLEFMGTKEMRGRYGRYGVTGMVDSDHPVGAIGDETQLSLFTMDALIRAFQQCADGGSCSGLNVTRRAYWRWLDTQGSSPKGIDESQYRNGWLVDSTSMRVRRSPSPACLTALESGMPEDASIPINLCPGPTPLGRVAPLGLVVDDPLQLGVENAALTHGHPDALWATGAFTLVIRSLTDGEQLSDAVEGALRAIEMIPDAAEVTASLRRALTVAATGPPTLKRIAQLGTGWTAPEALAIGLYCALSTGDPLEAIIAAVNTDGPSDVLGAVCGNLIGTGLGEGWIPVAWIDVLDAKQVIDELLADFTERCINGIDVDRDRYPGIDVAQVDDRPVHGTA